MMRTCEEPKEPTYKIALLKRAVMELRLQGYNAIPTGILREHYVKLTGISDERAKKHLSLAAKDGLLIPSGKGKSTAYTPAADWQLIDESGSVSTPINRGVDNPNRIHDNK
jgi:hypothetical protein